MVDACTLLTPVTDLLVVIVCITLHLHWGISCQVHTDGQYCAGKNNYMVTNYPVVVWLIHLIAAESWSHVLVIDVNDWLFVC